MLELPPLELPPVGPLELALELTPPPELFAEGPVDVLAVDVLPPIPPPNVELRRQLGQAIVSAETGPVETLWKQPPAKATRRAETVRILTTWSIAPGARFGQPARSRV